MTLLSCEEKNKRCMHPQAHRGGLCIKPCRPREEKTLCHTKQQLKNMQKPKPNCQHNQSCGSRKTFPPHKEKKQKNHPFNPILIVD
jgi:hypothetical protein